MVENGLLEVFRKFRADDQLLDLVAEVEKVIQPLHFRGLEQPVDLRLEIAVVHEAPVAPGRDDESAGNLQAQPVPDLTEVCGLSAHLAREVPVHLVEREDQLPFHDALLV